MDQSEIQSQVQALQTKYAALLTAAAQEGRTQDVQTLSNQMQQEIQLRASLRPGDCFTLRVERVAADALRFRVSCGGRELASGRLRAEPA